MPNSNLVRIQSGLTLVPLLFVFFFFSLFSHISTFPTFSSQISSKFVIQTFFSRKFKTLTFSMKCVASDGTDITVPNELLHLDQEAVILRGILFRNVKLVESNTEQGFSLLFLD